jgi:hypothetical protein
LDHAHNRHDPETGLIYLNARYYDSVLDYRDSALNCCILQNTRAPSADLQHRASMARIARVVVPGAAHHVSQRGKVRQQTFFSDDDRLYRDMLAKAAPAAKVSVLGWVFHQVDGTFPCLLTPFPP